jgi:hypothetical protein
MGFRKWAGLSGFLMNPINISDLDMDLSSNFIDLYFELMI